jgi:hypothetical protein
MTVNTNHVAAQPADPRRLWERWVALWNGDLSVAEEAVAAGVLVHVPGAGSAAGRVHGRQALVELVATVRAGRPEARLTVEVGPIVGPALVAGRWVLSAGRPGRSTGPVDLAGIDLANIDIASTDIVRIEAGRIAECWIGHDGRLLREQPRHLAAAS